jgi:hypothetical protein
MLQAAGAGDGMHDAAGNSKCPALDRGVYWTDIILHTGQSHATTKQKSFCICWKGIILHSGTADAKAAFRHAASRFVARHENARWNK